MGRRNPAVAGMKWPGVRAAQRELEARSKALIARGLKGEQGCDHDLMFGSFLGSLHHALEDVEDPDDVSLADWNEIVAHHKAMPTYYDSFVQGLHVQPPDDDWHLYEPKK